MQKVEEIFKEEEDEAMTTREKIPRKNHKLSEMLKGKCERTESLFQPELGQKGRKC